MISRLPIIIILQLFFVSCSNYFVKQKTDYNHYSLKNNTENAAVTAAIEPFKTKVEVETSKVIALSESELTKDGAETTLGNFVCDAIRFSSLKEFKNDSVNMVLMNRGGLRINLPKGDIKVSTIFELMPFENELVLLKVKGESLIKFLPLLKEKKHPFYGLKVTISGNEVLVKDLSGNNIEKEKIYCIATSDYLANGGDSFVFLKEAIEIKRCNLKIRDAIIEYCQFLNNNNKTIKSYTDGRLEISK